MSRDMVYEDVPRLSKRVGDSVIASSNNSTILLGRDRAGSVDSGYGSVDAPGKGKGTGAMHLVVGRNAEDPDFNRDSATVYISAKTDADVLGGTTMIGESQQGKSAVLLRGDCVRIIPRHDFKISVGSAYLLMDSGGNITIEGQISLGEQASQRMILGDAFAAFWSTVVIPTPSGLSSPPPPLPSSVFSSRVRLK